MELSEQAEIVGICGHNDEFLRLVRKSFGVQIVARGMGLAISGENEDEVCKVERLFRELYFLYKQDTPLTEYDVRYAVKAFKDGVVERLHTMYADTIIHTLRGRQVKAKTLGQQMYIEAIRSSFITFGIGPAGTGKTYLAVALAVAALKSHQVERIILTRPVVEAGEKLGFLPGDLREKIDPYLRPLYDGMYDLLGYETFQRYLSKGIIEGRLWHICVAGR